MKKVIASLLLVATAFVLSADDALVLPIGVLRARITNTYAFFDEEYDDSGDAQDYTDTKLYLIGGALELGIIEQITLGLQWAPAASVWSDIDSDNAKLTGLDRLFLGTKIQFLGDQGYIKNDTIRFAITPGVIFPLQKYDVKEALTNNSEGKDFQTKSVDNEALGVGGRLHLDYVVNDDAYINLYSQMIYNFPVDRNADLAYASQLALNSADPYADYEHEYGFEYFVELDPHYEFALTEKSDLRLNIPVRYKYTPELKIDGAKFTDSGYLVTIAPELGYYSAAGAFPWIASVYYSIPVMGENVIKTNSITFQIKTYLRLFE